MTAINKQRKRNVEVASAVRKEKRRKMRSSVVTTGSRTRSQMNTVFMSTNYSLRSVPMHSK